MKPLQPKFVRLLEYYVREKLDCSAQAISRNTAARRKIPAPKQYAILLSMDISVPSSTAIFAGAAKSHDLRSKVTRLGARVCEGLTGDRHELPTETGGVQGKL